MTRTVPRKAAKKKGGRARTAAHDDKRQQIIERCADLFDSGGYHRATMQMLADEMGLGKPTLYHYFTSKTEILYAIHQKHIASLIERLDSEQRRGASHSDLLIHACRDILEEIAEHPGYVRTFFEHYGELDGPMRAEIRARRQEYFDKICGIIKSGIASGEFRKSDVELTALGFLGMCSWAYQWYPPMVEKISPQKLAENLCSTFLHGLSKGR
jgi:AcrR family transcriptional regulator